MMARSRMFGMRIAAQLVALARELAGRVGCEPDEVGVSRDRIALAAQGWNPEAVDDVARVQDEIDGPADGQVELVSGVHVGVGILELPPELVADDLDVHRAAWGWRLGLKDDGQRQKQDVADDDHRTRRPGYLDDGVAVDLGRQLIVAAAAVAYRCPDQ